MSGPARGRPSARRKGGAKGDGPVHIDPSANLQVEPATRDPASDATAEVRRASSSPPRPSARASQSRARASAKEAAAPPKSKRKKGAESDRTKARVDAGEAAPPARAPRASRARSPVASSEVSPNVDAGSLAGNVAQVDLLTPVTTSNGAKRSPSRGPADGDNVLYDIESAVDQLLQDADSIAGDPRARRRAAEAMTALAERLSGYAGAASGGASSSRRAGPAGVIARVAKFAMRHRSDEVDAFGLDLAYEARLRPLLDSLHERWFRVHTRGIENVPASGRVMLVANHGGLLPLDALMVATSLRVEHSAARATRWLAEDFTFHMPFVGSMLTRLGAVRACPENAERVLDDDGALTVFPEGLKGVSKLFQDRYSLQRFGRGGYVKVALRTGSPIVPVGIVGAEEAYPLLLKSDRLARWLGVPLLPVTPLFPWLGPAGLVPLPSRFEIHFGEPIPLDKQGERDTDPLSVSRINELVRGRVQALVESARTARGAAFG